LRGPSGRRHPARGSRSCSRRSDSPWGSPASRGRAPRRRDTGSWGRRGGTGHRSDRPIGGSRL